MIKKLPKLPSYYCSLENFVVEVISDGGVALTIEIGPFARLK
jgi:hypothetical protein